MFQISKNKLFCNIYNEEKKYSPREGIRDLERHLKLNSHRNAAGTGIIQTRLQFTDSYPGESAHLVPQRNYPCYP